ncbi:TD and POZ domain-containing protein 4 [Hordeum vulgare]|nr:TD and POZ domain-containing protein 4 [Hordeum vulgare]
MSFTGVSVITEGRPARSVSAVSAGDASHGYHLLIVDGYSRTKSTPTGKSIRSGDFKVGGYLWHIEFYPNGNKSENAEFLSFHVRLLHNDVALANPVKLHCCSPS